MKTENNCKEERLKNEVSEILGLSIGYNFKTIDKKDAFIFRYNETKAIDEGGLNLSQYSFYNFERLKENLNQYINRKLTPREDLLNYAIRHICEENGIEEAEAKQMVENFHAEFVNNIKTCVENASKYTVAAKIGNCYFAKRIAEVNKAQNNEEQTQNLYC